MADEITYDLSHMGSLSAAITFMFAEASGLPEPHYVSIFGILDGRVHDSVSLQFAPHEASIEAIVAWAARFGGVMESHHQDGNSGPELWVRTDFTYEQFLRVGAFAHIPLPALEAITGAEQDSEPEPATWS
jgi:hypothetical protein